MHISVTQNAESNRFKKNLVLSAFIEFANKHTTKCSKTLFKVVRCNFFKKFVLGLQIFPKYARLSFLKKKIRKVFLGFPSHLQTPPYCNVLLPLKEWKSVSNYSDLFKMISKVEDKFIYYAWVIGEWSLALMLL